MSRQVDDEEVRKAISRYPDVLAKYNALLHAMKPTFDYIEQLQRDRRALIVKNIAFLKKGGRRRR